MSGTNSFRLPSGPPRPLNRRNPSLDVTRCERNVIHGTFYCALCSYFRQILICRCPQAEASLATLSCNSPTTVLDLHFPFFTRYFDGLLAHRLFCCRLGRLLCGRRRLAHQQQQCCRPNLHPPAKKHVLNPDSIVSDTREAIISCFSDQPNEGAYGRQLLQREACKLRR